VVSSAREVDSYLERGRAWLALSLPSGYGDAIASNRPQTLQLIADGSDANSTNVALGYATNLLGAYSQERGVLDPRVQVWFNPRLESRHFMIPGVLALLLLAITTILAAMGIVRERELGTLEQLNVTPLRRWELIVGKLLPYGVIAMVDVLLVTGVAVLWFEVPLRGSFWLLLAMSLVYVVCTLALGLFISTVSETQQQ